MADILLLEICRYGTWITATLAALKFSSAQRLPNRFIFGLHSSWMLSIIGFFILKYLSVDIITNSTVLIWCGLLLSIVCVICVEQLFRNTGHYRLIKLYSLIIGGMFAYDVFLFSYSLIFNVLDTGLWQARGAINSCAAILMTIGAIMLSNNNQHSSRIAISRPVAFYTTSLTVSGGFLMLMGLGSYYLQLYGGSWSNIIKTIILFISLLCIVTLFISETLRSRINVLISKHFFRHKYDYREEWIKLINSLSHTNNNDNPQQVAIKTLASIFKSPKGALWLKKEQSYNLSTTLELKLANPAPQEPLDSPFINALKNNEWVFSPLSKGDDSSAEFNELLPTWLHSIPDLWLVIPLLTENDLLGFVILTEPSMNSDITWEDLDLLKTVGRQVASFLDRHKAAELLAESRQFEAFNKLSAFIMHDLKNLIAQQTLMVENAAKHKDNPAFIEDAFNTIDNSVSRMNTLLKKLQQDEPSDYRTVNLDRLLVDVVNKYQNKSPRPSLHKEASNLSISADPDRLLMTLSHIIKNAQEATNNDGFIDVTLSEEPPMAIITVEDNGSGMSKDFLDNHFFKPFSTTKSGKGMGIGVYQTKEYVESLGGNVSVESSEGNGTQFIIRIPSIKT